MEISNYKGKKMIVSILILVMAITQLFGVFGNRYPFNTVMYAQAAARKLNKTSVSLFVGKTTKLKMTGTKYTPKWYTSNSKVAAVSKSGKQTAIVKAKKKGTAMITAKVGNKKYTCKVTVKQPVTSVKLNKTSFSLTKKGGVYKLQATTAPASANLRTVTWKSSNTKVAVVNSAGKVKAVGNGTATITATAKDGSKKYASCKVTVKIPKTEKPLTAEQKKEQEFVAKYLKDKKTSQVIIVQYKSGSNAALSFHQKGKDGLWSKILSTYAYVGYNGINKQREGDGKTPTGTYDMKMAFGIKKNPGTKLPYTKLTDTMYWCGDKAYYNKFVDTSKINHKCNGEHLKRYVGHYNYCIAIDYNKECIYQKGSAIFLHCSVGTRTAGCVAIPEEKLVTILKKAEPGIKIIIK